MHIAHCRDECAVRVKQLKFFCNLYLRAQNGLVLFFRSHFKFRMRRRSLRNLRI